MFQKVSVFVGKLNFNRIASKDEENKDFEN